MHGPESLPGVQQQCSGQLLAVDFKHNSAPNGGACFLNNFASLLSLSSNFTSNTANASAPALQLQSIVNATVTGNIFNGCAWPRPAGSWLGMAFAACSTAAWLQPAAWLRKHQGLRKPWGPLPCTHRLLGWAQVHGRESMEEEEDAPHSPAGGQLTAGGMQEHRQQGLRAVPGSRQRHLQQQLLPGASLPQCSQPHRGHLEHHHHHTSLQRLKLPPRLKVPVQSATMRTLSADLLLVTRRFRQNNLESYHRSTSLVDLWPGALALQANQATSSGGALFRTGGVGPITSSYFISNTAVNGGGIFDTQVRPPCPWCWPWQPDHPVRDRGCQAGRVSDKLRVVVASRACLLPLLRALLALQHAPSC